jgi:hypothetical protein
LNEINQSQSGGFIDFLSPFRNGHTGGTITGNFSFQIISEAPRVNVWAGLEMVFGVIMSVISYWRANLIRFRLGGLSFAKCSAYAKEMNPLVISGFGEY